MLHNVHQVSKHVKESKNTGCPAVLKITIQRYFSLPKHKDPLPEVIEFPALCELLYLHNHLLDSAAVKKFRPLSNLTQKRLIEWGQFTVTCHVPNKPLLFNFQSFCACRDVCR
ncbi:uncharacterized protein LOC129961112 [Argiope bruennichi]|uniref:uncharacterized protein LOC129961112 n=1 Tax=Argiope bruennichi TaxID=94029 RepID=UPI00249508B7|nr:uncharacterized protein LOC129961112 [Argiope bruennichi]